MATSSKKTKAAPPSDLLIAAALGALLTRPIPELVSTAAKTYGFGLTLPQGIGQLAVDFARAAEAAKTTTIRKKGKRNDR